MADKDDRGMDVADMKRLLTKSKSEPVNAVALSGKTAVMMLHKIKAPKAVSKELIDKFDDAKAPRWGTAFVGANEMLAQLDSNPFVPLQTQKTLSATLAALKKSIS